jgi:hypothetical protein
VERGPKGKIGDLPLRPTPQSAGFGAPENLDLQKGVDARDKRGHHDSTYPIPL